jgi:ApaG protein
VPIVYSHTSHGITISVEVEYLAQDRHDYGPDQFAWAYHITMRNSSDEVVQLKTRHWTITDGFGRVHKVNGEGVVGQKPRLQPGQSYAYTSGCPLPTPSGSMSGYYVFVREDGAPLKVIIPAFSLDLPDPGRVLN